MTARFIWTEVKLLSREPLAMIVSLLFPIVLLSLLAGSFGTAPDPDFGGVTGVDFYVPVYATATTAVMGLLSVPTHLAGYREQGVLRRFAAAGVADSAVLGAQVAVMALLVGVGSTAMIVLGFAVYDLSAPASPVGVAVGLAMGTLAFAAIGLLLGSLAPTARAAQGLGLLLFFGLFFVAGGGPPPALLPDAITTLVDYTPLRPLVDAVSDPWHGAGWNLSALSALAAIAVVAWLLGYWVAGKPMYLLAYGALAVLGLLWSIGRRPLPLAGERRCQT